MSRHEMLTESLLLMFGFETFAQNGHGVSWNEALQFLSGSKCVVFPQQHSRHS